MCPQAGFGHCTVTGIGVTPMALALQSNRDGAKGELLFFRLSDRNRNVRS
jgi:hypothetical protein